MTPDHRYYWSGMGPFYSVTTILDILHKPALYEWLKRIVAQLAVEQYPELGRRIVAEGSPKAVEWLRAMPGYQRDQAARLGSAVHRLADMAARGHQMDGAGFQISEQVQPYVDAFRRFLDRYGASSIVSSEKAVIHFTHGYAGTYDLILVLNGELWMVDIKSSRQLYPETGLQLAAYGHAEYVVLPNDPVLYPMPPIQRYGVLHLRPDRYADGFRFVEYQVRERDFRAFLAARDLWEWRKEGRFTDTSPVPVPA